MKDRSVNQDGASVTDTAMLRSAVDNDQAAWCSLVETYSGRVYRWARTEGLQDSDAADVTNQVFMLAARALAGFRRKTEGDTFRGWLRRITQNVIVDFRRAQARQPCVATGGTDNHNRLLGREGAAEVSSQSGRVIRTSTREDRAADSIREKTDPRVWRVFWLATTTEMSAEDIARECDVSANVVCITKHRIAKRIRQELDSIPPHPS